MDAKELTERTKKFAVSSVKLSESLPDTYLGKHIKGQLIRCSTSVAANYRATRLSQSTASFIAKLSIVVEEADEACFWIDLSLTLGLFRDTKIATSVMKEAKELTAIFVATRKTMNLKRKK